MAGRFSFRFLSLFLTAAVLLLFPAAEAETPPETTGPSLAAGEGPIAPGRRIARLRDAKERLTAFLSGDRLIEVPPAALFTVDLSDEEAIARRVKELSAKVDRFAAEGKKEAPLPANDHGKPPSGEEEVRQLEADIDRLRLAFLSLPKD